MNKDKRIERERKKINVKENKKEKQKGWSKDVIIDKYW